jgi:hypothetical protein
MMRARDEGDQRVEGVGEGVEEFIRRDGWRKLARTSCGDLLIDLLATQRIC